MKFLKVGLYLRDASNMSRNSTRQTCETQILLLDIDLKPKQSQLICLFSSHDQKRQRNKNIN